jgi:predicted O-methyltransferase YrrM
MSTNTWKAVDDYFGELLVPQDAALDDALKAATAAGLPEIQVSPSQGKLLHLIARMIRARRILEIGTLGGYSTIWMARALPEDGRLLTLEYNPKHAEVSRKNFVRAGVDKKIEVRVGKALDSLPKVEADKLGPFDLIFIDANKSDMDAYFSWSLRLSRPGSVIIADNVVRDGAVLNPQSSDADIQGVRRFAELLSKEKRVSATTIQTVGAKGYDGFTLILVQ